MVPSRIALARTSHQLALPRHFNSASRYDVARPAALNLQAPKLPSRNRRVPACLVQASAQQLQPKPQTGATASSSATVLPYSQHKWLWKDGSGAEHRINYVTAGCGQPVLLIHGFGASAGHFRKNIAELSKSYKVYAIDLLGFGGSAKPPMQYSMELWRDQVLAFCQEFIDAPVVLIGNSIGSLVCLMVNASLPEDRVRGTVLLNSAGAMNNKGIVADWRIVLAYPLFLLVDLLLSIQPIANWLFESFRRRETLRNVLQKVYRNVDAVDDALVDLIHTPSNDTGALAVFISVLTGPPGPKPWDLAPNLTGPLLVMWGDQDTLTPADGVVGQYFKQLATTRPSTVFTSLKDVGHCPHDDRPELVHELLMPWLLALNKPEVATAKAAAFQDLDCVETIATGPDGQPATAQQ